MRFDLNLVSVLEAVMQEKNVTRAAEKLAMSQPAVSNALARARKVTKDELFIKTARGVQPTVRMQAMWPDLQTALQTMRSTLLAQSFDPSTDTTSISVAVTDSLTADVIPSLSLRIFQAAPHVRLKFAIHTNAGSLQAIDNGMLDCAIGMFASVPVGLHVKGIMSDRYVCVMRREHPLAEHMTFEDFVSHPQVLVMPSGQELGVIDGWLTLQQRTRNIVNVVNHFSDALRIVVQSDLLTCIPKRLVSSPAALDQVHICEIPFETEKLLYKLVWHDRVHNHPAHSWCREQIQIICDGLLSAE